MNDRDLALARIEEACRIFLQERWRSRTAEEYIESIKTAISEYESTAPPADLGVSVSDGIGVGDRMM